LKSLIEDLKETVFIKFIPYINLECKEAE